jgi:digeranylgeranylglycerophospholipid reductase
MGKLDHILSYDKEWHARLGKRHETFDRIKNGIYNFSDDKFNSIAHSFAKVPSDKRTLGNLFKTALIHNPSLLIEVAKVFL